MSLAQDATAALWQAFMPRRAEIPGRIGDHLVSLRTFAERPPAAQAGAAEPVLPAAPVSASQHVLEAYAPAALFTKYALVEVEPGGALPAGMGRFSLVAGGYAVFEHTGPARLAPQTFGYIFGDWLPRSGYQFEPRPQFEVMAEDYDPQAPDARESIWIPINYPEHPLG